MKEIIFQMKSGSRLYAIKAKLNNFCNFSDQEIFFENSVFFQKKTL